MKNLPELIKREFWEHPFLYIGPLAFAMLIVLGVLFGILRGTEYAGLSEIVRELEGAHEAPAGLATGAFSIWIVFVLVTMVSAAYYLLDCLYTDRKDRSIMFWKSLPISDTDTVLSKLATAAIGLPLIAFAAALATTLAVLVIGSVAVLFGGGNPLTLLWGQFPLLAVLSLILGSTLWHAIWFLPLTGWLLFASATSRRRPFLLAVLVPIGVILVEKITFDTHVIANTIGKYTERLYESLYAGHRQLHISGDGDSYELRGDLSGIVEWTGPLTDPALYVGVALGVGLIVATIFMRRRRVELT